MITSDKKMNSYACRMPMCTSTINSKNSEEWIKNPFCASCEMVILQHRNDKLSEPMKCDTVKNFNPAGKFYVYTNEDGDIVLERFEKFYFTTCEALAESIIEKESRFGNKHA